MNDSVPDHDTPASNRPAEHISSPQWQGFEMRMRARRADRCLQRASSAVENGSVTEARDALDEARRLSPADPRVADLDARLATLTASQIAAPTVPELDVIHPVELKTFSESQPIDETATNVPAAFSEPAALVREIDIDFDSTPYSDSLISAEIAEAPPIWQAPQAASVSVGAFEPVLDLDRLRTPVVATWSGVTLGAPSRDRSRAAGVLACGVLLSALAGWQAWEHKDQWNSFLPSAQPDVDANTGLAANSSRPEPVAAPVVQEPSSPASLAAAPSHPEPVLPEPAQHEDGLPDAALRASGTSGDAAPAAAVRPSTTPPSPELTAAAARREPEVSTTATTGVLPRQPESTAVLPAIENRTSTPLTSTATPPAATAPDPATTGPSPLPTPSVPTPSAPASGSQANPAFTRTEPSPPLPAPPPPPPASSATTSPTASPNASASTSPAASSSVRDQSAAVRAALTRYETAYSKLDVSAVQSVWPSLDQHALSRAFDGLASQRVSLGNCSVNVNGRAARADCSGTAAWTPKIGGGERTASRKWTFDLSESDGAWRIVRVQAR